MREHDTAIPLCTNCGKPVTSPRHRDDPGHWLRYCDKECRIEAFKRRDRTRTSTLNVSPTKVCKTCQRELPRESFNRQFKRDGSLKGWYYKCRDCCDEIKSRYVAHPNPDDPTGSTVRVKLTRGKWAIIDAADADSVLQFRWSVTVTPHGSYAMRMNAGNKYSALHRFIMGEPEGLEVDHIDGDTLNNSRSNLRVATSRQNGQNTRLASTNRSGFKGVYFSNSNGKWIARISINNRGKTLGLFDDPIEAALAYDEAVRIEAGEFGRYNFPHEGERPVNPMVDKAS